MEEPGDGTTGKGGALVLVSVTWSSAEKHFRQEHATDPDTQLLFHNCCGDFFFFKIRQKNKE